MENLKALVKWSECRILLDFYNFSLWSLILFLSIFNSIAIFVLLFSTVHLWVFPSAHLCFPELFLLFTLDFKGSYNRYLYYNYSNIMSSINWFESNWNWWEWKCMFQRELKANQQNNKAGSCTISFVFEGRENLFSTSNKFLPSLYKPTYRAERIYPFNVLNFSWLPIWWLGGC